MNEEERRTHCPWKTKQYNSTEPGQTETYLVTLGSISGPKERTQSGRHEKLSGSS